MPVTQVGICRDPRLRLKKAFKVEVTRQKSGGDWYVWSEETLNFGEGETKSAALENFALASTELY